MKRILAALFVCLILVSAVLPTTALATDFVGSVEQEGDLDTDPAPKTGDDIIYVAAFLIVTSIVGGTVLFITADRKKK